MGLGRERIDLPIQQLLLRWRSISNSLPLSPRMNSTGAHFEC